MKRKSLQMSYDADAKSKANSPDQKVQNQVYCNDLSVRLVDFSSQSLFFRHSLHLGCQTYGMRAKIGPLGCWIRPGFWILKILLYNI